MPFITPGVNCASFSQINRLLRCRPGVKMSKTVRVQMSKTVVPLITPGVNCTRFSHFNKLSLLWHLICLLVYVVRLFLVVVTPGVKTT